MHFVFVPWPITLVNLETEAPALAELDDARKTEATLTKTDAQGNLHYFAPDRPYGIERWLSKFVYGNTKLGAGDKGAKCVKRLRRAFSGAKPGSWVPIDSDIVEAVKEVIKTAEWIPAWSSQLTDFSDAFREAVEKTPEDGTIPSWYELPAGVELPVRANGAKSEEVADA